MNKNLDGSNSCNSTFDFRGYTDFQGQECQGTQLLMTSNKILNEKVLVKIIIPIEIDEYEIYTNGTSMLKLRYYSDVGETPISIRDMDDKLKDVRNLKYTNSHIYNAPGILTWNMDPGFGFISVSFGGPANVAGIPFKLIYPKPIIYSSRVLSMDIEKGITKIEFQGLNFGSNRKLITFMPNCYPFPYKIKIDYVNNTHLLISDYNKLTSLCPSRDFGYSICLDNFCSSNTLKEGYPPITINSIEGPSPNRTYHFNGFFLNSTTYSQLTPISQYGSRIYTDNNEIEFQITSPTYYQYKGNRAFKFWDKNANTSIAIPIQPSLLFEYGPPVLIETIELKDKLKVVGKFFMYDMLVYLDGMKLNSTIYIIENSSTFYISPKPRPGILTVLLPSMMDSKDNSSITITLNVKISSITSPTTNGGLVTIKGSGLFLKSENGQPLKSLFTINKKPTCIDAIEDINHQGSIIICKVLPGIGNKLEFKLIIGESPAAIYPIFSYQPPTITSIIQSSDIALLNGTNLGIFAKVSIYISTINSLGKSFFTLLPVISNTSYTIQFQIPDSIKTSNIYVDVGGQRSNTKTLIIVPFITSIASNQVPVNGGIVTIFGKYLNLQNYNIQQTQQQQSEKRLSKLLNDNGNNLVIKIGDAICKDVIQSDEKHYNSISCKMPPGSGGNYPVSIIINDELVQGNPKDIKFSYMPPTIINSTSASPTIGGLITIFGSQLAKPINVTIDQQPCIYINITDSSSLTCYLPPLSESLTSNSIKSNHPVQVIVNGQLGENEVFKYSIPESYKYKKDDGDKTDPNKVTWLIPAILIPCLFFLVAIIVLVIIYIRKYRKRRDIHKKLNEPIPPELIQ